MITLENLGLAYRKAKVDLYYSSHSSLEAIADYEENLHENLLTLQEKLNGEDESWALEPEFVGTWTLAPKSVDVADCIERRKEGGNGFIFSSPEEQWRYVCAPVSGSSVQCKPKAEFRVMADCTLDLHVLSTLWILEVGHLFDSRLTECAYGNRLRRTQDGKQVNCKRSFYGVLPSLNIAR